MHKKIPHCYLLPINVLRNVLLTDTRRNAKLPSAGSPLLASPDFEHKMAQASCMGTGRDDMLSQAPVTSASPALLQLLITNSVL